MTTQSELPRVALTQRVSVVEEYDERRDCLDQEWIPLMEELGFRPLLLPNRIKAVNAYLSDITPDAIIMTSGNDLTDLDNPHNPAPERDRFETAVLKHAIENETPVLGVCRGLEFLNVYFGGSLSQVKEHVATEHEVELHRHRIESDLKLPNTTTVNSYHNWGIKRDDVANDFRILGTAPNDTIEFVVHKTYPIWGIMWHPERESPSANLDRRVLKHVLGGNNQ